MALNINIPQVVNPSIGARVEFMYPGVWGYYPRRPMVATILEIVDDGDDYRIFIKPDELNLPRYIRAGEILSYIWEPEYFPGGLTDEHAARLCWFNAHGMESMAAASYKHHHMALNEVCDE